MKYDCLICGAGPAGLSSAIFAARAGLKVLVLEKYDSTGTFPRGETMRPDPIIEELLGRDFMDSISTNKTSKRRYWSPGSLKSFELERSHSSYIFKWKDLTEGLRKKAIEEGAKIQFNSEVTSAIIKNGKCLGVKIKDGSEYYGNTIIAANGHSSVLASKVDYSTINCPVTKRICHNINSDYKGMEFFFISKGSVDPAFPAALAFIFPRGNGDAEVGFSIISGGLSKKQRKRMPSREKLLPFLDKLFKEYPVFSQIVGESTCSFEGASEVPMGGLHKNSMDIPGLVLIGDTIGLVEASGGCGIVPSLKNGKFIVDFLSRQNNIMWDKKMMRKFNKKFGRTELRKSIASKYRKIIPLMRVGFSIPLNKKEYARFWNLISFFYSKA